MSKENGPSPDRECATPDIGRVVKKEFIGNLDYAGQKTLAPREPEKALEFCSLMMKDGMSKAEAMKVVGISHSTAYRWIRSPWWPAVVESVRKNTNTDIQNRARAAVLRGLKDGDVDRAAKLGLDILRATDLSFVDAGTKLRLGAIAAESDEQKEEKQGLLDGLTVDQMVRLKTLLDSGANIEDLLGASGDVIDITPGGENE